MTGFFIQIDLTSGNKGLYRCNHNKEIIYILSLQNDFPNWKQATVKFTVLFIQGGGWLTIAFRDPCLRHYRVYCLPFSSCILYISVFSAWAVYFILLKVMCNRKRIVLLQKNKTYFIYPLKPTCSGFVLH